MSIVEVSTRSTASAPPATRRLRIAYVVHSMLTGGLERCVARLCNHLDTEQFDVMVVCLDRSGSEVDRITRADVPVVALRKKSGNDFRVIMRLARLLREHRIDIVQSHNWGTLLETTFARSIARVPVHVHAEHGQELAAMKIRGIKHQLHRLSRRFAFRRVDAIVACAESVRQRLANHWRLAIENVEFIPNGVDAPATSSTFLDRRDFRRRLGIGDNSVVIGSVGRLAPVKDFGTAIQSIQTLRSKGCDVHLVLVGDGGELQSLKDMTQQLNLEQHVHLVGHQDNIGDWLNAFDIYVNSSLSEAMNLGILEAMSVGLPVVATVVGDNKEMLPDSYANSLMPPAGEPALLADCLEKLVQDAGLRATIGMRAKARFQACYQIERMVDDYASLYVRLANR